MVGEQNNQYCLRRFNYRIAGASFMHFAKVAYFNFK